MRSVAHLGVGALSFTFILVFFSCADPVSFENPYDPETSGSPLAVAVSVLDFFVDDGPGGSKLASLSWEPVAGADQYEARISGDGSEVYSVTTGETEFTGVEVAQRAVYTAEVRYRTAVTYQGATAAAWSPFQELATFDTGQEPGSFLPFEVNVAEYQVTYDPSEPSRAQLVITFEIPDWDGEPAVFARIEPDPYETSGVEILTSELTFFLPIDWDNTYRVIAYLDDGSSETIELIEVGTLEEQDPLVQQLVYVDSVVLDAVFAQSEPDTRVSEFTRLIVGAGATDLSGVEQLTGLTNLELRNTEVTDLGPISELTNLEWLVLDDTPVTDLTPISELTNIFFLDLDRSGVTDLSPVANLTNLNQLEFVETGVSDLSPLSGLPNLRTIWAPRSQVSDISPILTVTSLENFYFYELDGLTSIAGIGALTNLRFVNLSNNPNLTTGVDELASVTGMESVNLIGSLAVPAGDYGAIETAYTGVTGFVLRRPDGSTFAP